MRLARLRASTNHSDVTLPCLSVFRYRNHSMTNYAVSNYSCHVFQTTPPCRIMPFSVSASQTTIMTESIRLPAASLKPATVALPGSKSISNRTLLLAALSDNTCEIHSLLKSDDTDRMLEALDKLGVEIEYLAEGRLKVHGTGGRFPNRTADLF